jgi:hypothetical protein
MFHTSPFVQLEGVKEGLVGLDWDILGQLADWAGTPVDGLKSGDVKKAANEIFWIAGYRATAFILDRVREFSENTGRNLLVILGYASREVKRFLDGADRQAAPVLEYLDSHSLRYVDLMANHRADYAAFNLSSDEYLKRYYIGHYNPAGNHFSAFSIKDAIVDWLDPKPPTYRHRGPAISFKGYLDVEN